MKVIQTKNENRFKIAAEVSNNYIVEVQVCGVISFNTGEGLLKYRDKKHKARVQL